MLTDLQVTYFLRNLCCIDAKVTWCKCPLLRTFACELVYSNTMCLIALHLYMKQLEQSISVSELLISCIGNLYLAFCLFINNVLFSRQCPIR